MKVFSINPNSNKYFEDNCDHVTNTSTMHQGVYNYTPIYPLYTFSTSGRFNYEYDSPVIEFYTMLPIKRLFGNFLVEIRFRFIISAREENSLNNAIDEFNKFCEMNKKSLNVKTLIF